MNPSQNKKIIIYSTPTCHFCAMAKQYLTEKNFQFENFDVASDVEKRKEMMDKSGQLGVPVIDIDGQIIIGFNRPKINAALGITG